MSKELAQNIEKTPHRAVLKALGLTDDDLLKPIVAVISAFNEVDPSHEALKRTAEYVKQGIALSGGTAFVMPLLSICNTLSLGQQGSKYALLSRELIADSVENLVLAHEFDGVVLLGSNEETVAGMLMGAARANVPSILLSGGVMRTPLINGKKTNSYSAFEGVGAVRSGRITLDELKEIENNVCPNIGTLNGPYSFHSLNILSEALGISLPGNGTILAGTAERDRLAKRTGQAIMKLISNDTKPKMVMTKQSFYNAITVDMALGGSTSSCLHLLALAEECQVRLNQDIIQQISDKTPVLCKLYPLSDDTIEDFDSSGGVMALMNELEQNGLIEKGALCVSNKNISRSFNNIKISENGVIRPFSNPHSPVGGITFLKGNIGEDCAMVRRSAVDNSMQVFSGKARVYDSEDDALTAIMDGLISKGEVLVIRYEGPSGGPGMRTLTNVSAALSGMGLNDGVALLTDGRIPDSYLGLTVCHVCPEASEGGKLAILKDGDKIEIDLIKGRLNVDVNAKEVQLRTKKWKPQDVTLAGSLLRYSHLVTPAYLGAGLKKKF